MKLTILLLTCVVIGGSSACAGFTDDERYERENRLILAREDYAIRAEQCRKSGGEMKIRRFSSLREFDYFEYKNARCVR